MSQPLRLVLDIGKTTAKLSAWTGQGKCVARFSRANETCTVEHYAALDAAGIDRWLGESLKECGSIGRIGSIIPVGHGAAAAVLRDNALAVPVVDYEFPIPDDITCDYARERDPEAVTGSPLMHQGLNLGRQLYFLQRLYPHLFDERATIVPWAQFWAWRLSGVAVCEVSSLGAHTDLWSPLEAAPSPMARRLGWAARFAPRVAAGTAIGHLTAEWQQRTGLGPEVVVHAGLHDSNAALHAARARGPFVTGDATMISTGTWFVTMRSPAPSEQLDLARFVARPGCLANVDLDARPVPTALFMGGREFENLALKCGVAVDDPVTGAALGQAAQACLAREVMALPCWHAGTGPFPDRTGGWLGKPQGALEQTAAALLYLALMADAALDLVGARRLAVIDGRFANVALFAGALAGFRPDLDLFVANAENDVALGALRAADPAYPISEALRRIERHGLALGPYRDAWRRAIAFETDR